jgi:hypothetical protein
MRGRPLASCVPDKSPVSVTMNIFTLRSKLKSVGANEQVVTELQEEIRVSIPERIGLDQLFEMSNTELHAISPRNTFSTLRKPRLSRTFEKPAVTAANIGLDALLLMDNETADKLFDK